MQVPSKRLLAFMIDYLILFILAGVTGLFMVLTNHLNNTSMNIWSMAIILLFMLKDGYNGISIGKRIMGIAIRKSSRPDLVPNLLVLMLRNLFICLWPIELVFFVVDHEHRRLAGRLFNVQVISTGILDDKGIHR